MEKRIKWVSHLQSITVEQGQSSDKLSYILSENRSEEPSSHMGTSTSQDHRNKGLQVSVLSTTL